jgi:hypothetical protein
MDEQVLFPVLYPFGAGHFFSISFDNLKNPLLKKYKKQILNDDENQSTVFLGNIKKLKFSSTKIYGKTLRLNFNPITIKAEGKL